MKKPETKFKEKAVEDIKTLKNLWYFCPQEVAVNGIHDIILCLNGYFISLELKTAVGKLSALQTYNRNRINDKGKGVSVKVDPENWKEVWAILLAIDALPPAGCLDKALGFKSSKAFYG